MDRRAPPNHGLSEQNLCKLSQSRPSGSLNTHHFPRLMGGRVDLRGAAPSPRRPGCTLVKRSPPAQDKKIQNKYKIQNINYKIQIRRPTPARPQQHPDKKVPTCAMENFEWQCIEHNITAAAACHPTMPPCYSKCHLTMLLQLLLNMPWSSSSNCHHIRPC